jgi:hypothetical protein
MREDNLVRKVLMTTLLLAAAAIGLSVTAGAADCTLTHDAYTSAANPNLNTGGSPALTVDGTGARTFLKFDLANLPAGTAGADVEQAMLRLWVNKVATPGSFDVVLVTGAWHEYALTHEKAPPLGGVVLKSVMVGAGQERNFLTLDLTAAIRGWLDSAPSAGPGLNHGIALVASAGTPGVAVAFDSKENEGTSHEPRLEVIVNGPPAPSGIGFIDPLLIATLRWDQAPLAYGDFAASDNPAGSYPRGVAFDGSNVWVTNEIHNTVTKLRARDGAILGTFAVGVRPSEAAFDGANLWVVCDNSVTKLRASDGAILGTFNVDLALRGVAFDGANVWVSSDYSNTVTKLRASDGAKLGTFSVGHGPHGIAFDGANIWVAGTPVTKLRASDGARLGTFSAGIGPRGVAFDGANIWVANSGNGTVTKLRASNGENLGTITVGAVPQGVAFDGGSVWVTNHLSNTVTKLRASDGAVLNTFAMGVSPFGVVFDGTSIWVANWGSHTVSKRSIHD